MRNDGENESGGKRRGGWREPGLGDRGGFHGPACSHSSDQVCWASLADSHLQDRCEVDQPSGLRWKPAQSVRLRHTRMCLTTAS